jgi:hypothetical protein
MAPRPEELFITKLRGHFQRIQHREGDQRLRETISASRAVTSLDRQMTEEDVTDWLAALDLLEKELLPPQ